VIHLLPDLVVTESLLHQLDLLRHLLAHPHRTAMERAALIELHLLGLLAVDIPRQRFRRLLVQRVQDHLLILAHTTLVLLPQHTHVEAVVVVSAHTTLLVTSPVRSSVVARPILGAGVTSVGEVTLVGGVISAGEEISVEEAILADEVTTVAGVTSVEEVEVVTLATHLLVLAALSAEDRPHLHPLSVDLVTARLPHILVRSDSTTIYLDFLRKFPEARRHQSCTTRARSSSWKMMQGGCVR
jgi:hypothetical protein